MGSRAVVRLQEVNETLSRLARDHDQGGLLGAHAMSFRQKFGGLPHLGVKKESRVSAVHGLQGLGDLLFVIDDVLPRGQCDRYRVFTIDDGTTEVFGAAARGIGGRRVHQGSAERMSDKRSSMLSMPTEKRMSESVIPT